MRYSIAITLDCENHDHEPAKHACQEFHERRHTARCESAYSYRQAFCGFELRYTTRLLLPPADEPHVSNLADLAEIAEGYGD